MDINTKKFILENENNDILKLSLQISKYPLVDMPLAIRQINGLQKIKSKVPSFYENRDILYPVQLSLEQSSSESTAKYKSNLCEGNILVDLTGGFGIDCFFMSAHFEQTIYVERQEELCKLALHNFNVLGKKNIEINNTESEKYLEKINNVDWIYIDPARRSKSGNKVVFLSDCEPDVSKLETKLMEKAKKVMIKLSPMMDISAAQTDLHSTSEIHIISLDNECKEILIILDQKPTLNIAIKTININRKYNQQFDFMQVEESEQKIVFSEKIESYLYEPNAAIMKSGAFKLVANRFSLTKLHQNTHLYTSNELIKEFPGRIFEVSKVWGNSKKDLKLESERIKKANITARNYPLSVNELRAKLKLKEGGDVYLFACTTFNESRIIIECKKI